MQVKSVLLKLSGAALSGPSNKTIDFSVLEQIGAGIKKLKQAGITVSIVIGGGNICRGSEFASDYISQTTADNMGMLATVINGLALSDYFDSIGIEPVIMSAFPVFGLVSEINIRKAIEKQKKGKLIIFVGGTGNPLVTTDTSATIRAIELKSDLLLKATGVDGVYNQDPNLHQDANLIEDISYSQVIKNKLEVMDLTAFTLCDKYKLPIKVFNISKISVIDQIINNKIVHTTIK